MNQLNGKMVSAKWLDKNKGDAANPNYGSRLLARKFDSGKDNTLYASTLRLETSRLIVSHAATVDPEYSEV